jgi:predicted acyl esterase
MEAERIAELCDRNAAALITEWERKALADAYMRWRRVRFDESQAKAQEWWERIGKKRAEKAAAHRAKCRERAAHRFEMGYASEDGHTFPYFVAEMTDLYLAGGVTLKQLGEKYGLSPGRIRQLIAREKKRRG